MGLNTQIFAYFILQLQKFFYNKCLYIVTNILSVPIKNSGIRAYFPIITKKKLLYALIDQNQKFFFKVLVSLTKKNYLGKIDF